MVLIQTLYIQDVLGDKPTNLTDDNKSKNDNENDSEIVSIFNG
jgi:hypothetical protein